MKSKFLSESSLWSCTVGILCVLMALVLTLF